MKEALALKEINCIARREKIGKTGSSLPGNLDNSREMSHGKKKEGGKLKKKKGKRKRKGKEKGNTINKKQSRCLYFSLETWA